MKIAFFTNNYLPNVYGVPMSIETFRMEFEKIGHEVFIFAPNFPGYADENKNVFRYPSLDIEIKFRLPLGIPYSLKMDKILENLDIDIIHSHHPNLLGSAALKWAKKKNVPLIFTWHTLYDQYTNFVPFLPAKFSAGWIIRKAVKYANQADMVVVPTESVVPIIRDWGVYPHTKKTSSSFLEFFLYRLIGLKLIHTNAENVGVGVNEKIFPVPTGVVENEFANQDRKGIREKYGIMENEILLLLVSRLTEEKNIQFLFETALEILKKNNQIKFMLAGDGYLLSNLKNEAEKENLVGRIIFPGIISRSELKNYYAAGDIFICASKSETQGMNVSEAMYCGLPIVAIDAPGISSLVENGRNGILVAENKGEFATAVEKLVEDNDLRTKMSLESAKIVREKYTSQICAEKMMEVYAEAIAEHNERKKTVVCNR